MSLVSQSFLELFRMHLCFKFLLFGVLLVLDTPLHFVFTLATTKVHCIFHRNVAATICSLRVANQQLLFEFSFA